MTQPVSLAICLTGGQHSIMYPNMDAVTQLTYRECICFVHKELKNKPEKNDMERYKIF